MTDEIQPPESIEVPAEPVKAPPIESRFLLVDVAALRAKQLRRGALPRLEEMRAPDAEARSDLPRKAERIAMEEIRRGLVLYEIPTPHPPVEGQS